MDSQIDPRFNLAYDALLLGRLQTLADLFLILPRTVISGQLGWNNNRITKFIVSPEKVPMDDYRKAAKVLKFPYIAFYILVENEIRLNTREPLIQLEGIIKVKRWRQKESLSLPQLLYNS